MEDYIASLKIKHLKQLNEYRSYLYEHPQLRHLFFELTQKCNERCFHCGSRCDATGMQGLPKEEFMRVLDDVKNNLDHSKVFLCITGGEPLLYPEFFELMEYAVAQGFRWGMTSNGTLITREVAGKLKKTGMETISVSIDGLEATHDLFRGRKGSFSDALKGIRNLIDEHGFKEIQVTTVINHENISELNAMYELFKDIDIDSWRVIGLEPIGRALDYPERMLTNEDQIRLLSFIQEKREEQIPVTYGCSHFLGLDYEREVRDWYFLCNAGVYTASVDANGNITACLDIERRPEVIQGNIRAERFSDVWKNKFQIFRRRLSSDCEECRACDYEEFCAGGSFHSWDFENNKQRICINKSDL